MEKYKIIHTILLVSVILSIQPVHAQQWDPVVELVSTGTYCELPSCVASGDRIHVVWQDFREGTHKIYYKRSPDQGLNWDPGRRISSVDHTAQSPGFSVWEDNIHITWRRYWPSDESDIFYCRSTDGGENFSDPVLLSNTITHYLNPDIAVFENQVHVVWCQYGTFPELNVYYCHSMDNGENWSAPVPLSPLGLESHPALIEVWGPNVYVFYEYDDPVSSQIMMVKSYDQGNTWTIPVSLVQTNMDDAYFDIALEGDEQVHLIWQDGRETTAAHLYHIYSHDHGVSWSPEQRLTFEEWGMESPDLEISKGIIYVCWSEWDGGATQVFYKWSDNNGIDWSEQMPVSESPSVSVYGNIGADGKNVFIVWEDFYTTHSDIYFRRSLDHSDIDEPGQYNANTPVFFQNNPNPCTLQTTISFLLPSAMDVTISIYNSFGSKVDELIGSYPAGRQSLQWYPSGINPGVYLMALKTNDAGYKTQIRKIIIL